MQRHLSARLAAAGLALALLAAPAAQALTTEQCAELLKKLYIDEVPQSVLEQPTVEEMVAALGDPYTTYFPPKAYDNFTASLSDVSLVGIGIVYSLTEEGGLVSSVLENSPALAGGLQEGDIICAVDGTRVAGLEIDVIRSLIQGEEGTEVDITYLRNGAEHTVTLIRATVVVPATTSELVDDHIGYISCTTFGSETVGHFKEALDAYGDKATVWIVDLRSNTGGLTDAATNSAGLFTGEGTNLYFRDGEGKYGIFPYSEKSRTLYPVIVLVNEQSASSSEVFAAAIRDRGAGIVVGTRTFGKGVAQTLVDKTVEPEYFAEGDAIKITSYRFFSPSGNTTDQIGVIPDVLVEPEMTERVAYLLAGPSPTNPTAGHVRIDLSWQWYVDLEKAKEDPEAFQVLLNAIPEGKKVWKGTDSVRWNISDLESIAADAGVDYQPARFPDHDECTYEKSISILKTFGLIKGKDDGAFHPQDTLTRAELCQMLANVFNCSLPTNESPFSDVAREAWYFDTVTAISNMGFIVGVGDGTFRPEDTLDHQQFITILARIAQWLNIGFFNAMAAATEETTNVVGVWEYDAWARDSAWLMSYSQKNYFGRPLSLLWADAHDIEPLGATTREEAAYAIYRLLSYTETLPV